MLNYTAPRLAEEFRKIFIVKYERDCKVWMTWKTDRVTGKASWVIDQSGDIVMRECRKFLSNITWQIRQDDTLTRKEQAKVAERVNTTHFLGSVIKELSLLKNVSTSFKDWDSNDLEVGTPAGIIDLRTGLLRDYSENDLISRRTRATPLHREPTVFLDVLRCGFKGDEEKVKYFQRICGMILAGHTDRGFFILYGEGKNGKSKIINAIAHAIGDYSKAGKESLFIKSRALDNDYYMYEYREVRLVTMCELNVSARWDTAKIKQMTGGDFITARTLRGSPVNFKIKAKVLLGTNSKPEFDAVDDGVRDRVHLIEFTGKPKVIDRHLPEKLEREAPEILAWMVEGYLDFCQQGFNQPACVLEDTEKYLEEENPVTEFKNEFMSKYDGMQSFRDVWFAWCMHCKESNQYAGSMKMFSKMLKADGVKSIRHADGVYLTNYKLTDRAELMSHDWSDVLHRRM